MVRRVLAIAFLFVCPIWITAQEVMTNGSVVTMTRAGFSDDFIVATIGRSQAVFDTSADGLIGLKNAGVVNRVVLAMVLKAANSATSTSAHSTASLHPSPPLGPVGARSFTASPPAQTPGNKPRVFCQARNHGEGWTASRDQSMVMSKDFALNCPEIRISVSQKMADYTVSLNHTEHGLVRDNQIQVANRNGDVISGSKDGWSIKGDVKKACSLIKADWAANQVAATGVAPNLPAEDGPP